MNKVLSTRQAAKILNVHLSTIYRYITKGLLPAYKLGGNGSSRRHWKVRQKDLETFMRGVGSAHGEPSNTLERPEQVVGSTPTSKERR